MLQSYTRNSPPRFFPLVNWRKVFAWFETGLIAIVAAKQWFCGTTRRSQILRVGTRNVPNFGLYALVVDIPLSHLTQKQEFVVFVECPTHVKNVRMHRSFVKLDHVLFRFLMKLEASRKFFHISREHFCFQTVKTHMFVQSGNQCLLMAICFQNQVSRHEQRRQEMPGPGIVPDKVKAGIGRIRRVSDTVASVVLKKHVVFVRRYGFVVKVVERIFEPDNVNVLKEKVIAHHGYDLHTNNLGHHHCDKLGIAVSGSRTGWNISKILVRQERNRWKKVEGEKTMRQALQNQ